MLRKIKRNEAYGILRKLDEIPCINEEELKASEKLSHLSAGRLVDQIQSYAESEFQTLELNRRCRAAGLKFFFDAGQRIQFKKDVGE
ncbi:hypothetical protein [Shewanella sp. GD03713]|uniref:hypothetical protein n=1 Tax=Shewanella TaxID=22 RepID=UPI00244CF87A|nr:hypothetical protein [Shewanella sp. GD03713]MDH1472541.1 hypothetical protein [Shewanella sp. GD03713]